MDIPQKIRAYPYQQVADDSPFMAQQETDISRQSVAYTYRCCRSTAQYNFPQSDFAPQASISAIETWTPFRMVSLDSVPAEECDLTVPWFHQSQMSAIRAVVRVITPSRGHCTVRIFSDDLVLAVAKTTGAGVKAVAGSTSGFHMWNTTRYANNETINGTLWRVSTHVVYIESPAVPADRRISIGVEVKLPADINVLLGFGGDATYYIESMYIEDVQSLDENA